MPAFKNKVWEKITTINSQYEEDKGIRGIQAGHIARLRLIEKKKMDEEVYNQGLEDLITNTGKTNAL